MTYSLDPSPLARALLSSIFAIAMTSSVFAQTPGTQPNILLIQMDDMGIDRMPSYGLGQNLTPTPTLDQIAANGVQFTNAWAHPMCSPARASMLTGRHAFRTGVGYVMPGPDLLLAETTIPEFLDQKNSGYTHAAIGKWHVSRISRGPEIPRDHGFSHFAGYLGLVDYYNWPRVENGAQSTSNQYAMTAHVDDALAWIGQQTDPWFCYLSVTSVHIPFHAPPANLHTQNLAGLDPTVDPDPFFQAMIEAMDNELGRLFATIDPAVLANTVVILTSDNGTEGPRIASPIPRFGGKGTPRETGVRVPLIISGPGVINPGRAVSTPVEMVDLFATVADIAGESIGAGIAEDSESLWPFATNPAHVAADPVAYSELFTDDPSRAPANTRLARDEQYKLIRIRFATGGLGESFYDLQADPWESTDLLSGTLTPTERAAYESLSQRIDGYFGIGNGFTSYGSTTCASSTGVPEFRAVGNPRLGSEYGLLVRGLLPSLPAAMYLGIDNTAFGPLPLPLDMQLLGAGAGCELLQSLNLEILTQTDPFGRIGLWIPVPQSPAVVGLSMYHQAVILDPLVTGVAFPIVLTNGISTVFSL